MAIVYQHESGDRVRASLANFFVFGAAMSLAMLAAAGEIHAEDVRRAMILLPAMLLGFVASRWAARWLDGGDLRKWLLGFSAVTSSIVLVTALV
jgi:uncharacterized membrane protein YfcA